jgi:hypothetical protein
MIGVKGRFIPCGIRNPLFQTLPMVTPLYPYFPSLHRAFLLTRQDIVPRPIRSALFSKKVTQIRGMAPLPCGEGICSSFVPQDQIAACPPRWSEKGFPRIFVFL